MTIELTDVEKARMYLAQIDALNIPNEPESNRDRMLERRAWLSTHLDQDDYASALILADAIDTRLIEQGHSVNFAVSVQEVREAADTDLTEARYALELLGSRETRSGVFSNGDSNHVIKIGDLGDWRELP
ncbi:hypothetical protein SAMN05444358_1011701 [Ruegeria halocynthiae]|uniref:Uncharacterized protein n=1 Tax=Ruegeria halocynthiae TaxID=985054 RepID=A0A1H2W7P6_9RHOB|nr:hypothetical protein [Ruegeria halocynthiae]SDW76610.1 hypothetical protein SAMN05444358_1011701 [Ruegeria halocynthiae]